MIVSSLSLSLSLSPPSLSLIGCHIGSIISFTLSALLCRYGFDGGWPSVFYVFGTIGILWFFLWLFVGYSSPAFHPRISARERAHIEESLAEQGTKEQVTDCPEPDRQTDITIYTGNGSVQSRLDLRVTL